VTISGPASTSAISATITALRAAELLAPDVVFHSPLSTRVRFEGREEVTALHRDIFAVIKDIDTTEPLTLGDSRSFSFRGRVRGVELEAMNLVRCNENGQIVDYTVFVRPLPGLATLLSALPPRVSARRRGRPMGAMVALVARPLAFAVRAVDSVAPRFL
jgi:hypothetical protein